MNNTIERPAPTTYRAKYADKYTYGMKIPAELGEKLRRSAKLNCRTIQGELEIAIRKYLQSPVEADVSARRSNTIKAREDTAFAQVIVDKDVGSEIKSRAKRNGCSVGKVVETALREHVEGGEGEICTSPI